jgi:hypothetical protein
VLQLDSAEEKFAARDERMYVVADAYAVHGVDVVSV